MIKDEIINKIISIVGKDNIKIDEPMRCHTSFKVGGPADLFVTPLNEFQIRDVIKLCNDTGNPVFVMGNGTNLVIRDKGIRGVIIKIFNNFNNISVEDNMITAQAGALLSMVSKTALKYSLKGLEFASGIPGTVGGALAMNAGAYNGEIKDVIYSADVLDNDYNIKTLYKDELELGYRTSIVNTKGFIVLRAKYNLKLGDYNEIKDRMDYLTKRRRDGQPLHLPSAGSTFKRPEGHFSAKLIDDAGLRGLRVGDAMVSEMHAGFIVNVGDAKAKDIFDLIKIVKDKVYQKFNVELEPEIKVIGEE